MRTHIASPTIENFQTSVSATVIAIQPKIKKLSAHRSLLALLLLAAFDWCRAAARGQQEILAVPFYVYFLLTNWATTVRMSVWIARTSGSTAKTVSPTKPRVIEPNAASFIDHPNFLAANGKLRSFVNFFFFSFGATSSAGKTLTVDQKSVRAGVQRPKVRCPVGMT